MHSLVFVVATLLVARLTAVPFERNSASSQGANFPSDGRVIVHFGAAASPPLISGSGKSVNDTSNGGTTSTFGSANTDPEIVAKPEQSRNMANLTRSERAYVANINSEKTVIFKKRGTVDSNSTGEPHMSERAYVANINSEKTVVFKKRGTVDSNSTGESHMSERAVIGTFNSVHSDSFNPAGPVNSDSTAAHSPILGDNKKPSEPFNLTFNKRAVIGTFNSLRTDNYNQGRIVNAQSYASPTQQQSFFSDYQQPSAAFYYSQAYPYLRSYYNTQNTAIFGQGANYKPFTSTADRLGLFAGEQLSSDGFYITETQSNSGGVPTIQRTVIFKKRGVVPPSSDVGKTGQFSEPAGSVNGSLST